MRLQFGLLFLLVAVTVRESAAASTVITTGPNGTINCDGMQCPPSPDGVRCLVKADTANGLSTVERQCVNPAGEVILRSSYNVESPGLTFARQTSTAILYTKS